MNRSMACLLACVAFGCGSSSGDDEVLGGGDTSGGSATVPGDAPVLTGCLADCSEHTVGDAFWQWSFSCDVTDPQGADSVETFGEVEAHLGADLVGTGALVCADESCFGSERADAMGTDCTSAEDYTFVFVAYDLEGNRGTGEAEGRQQ
jgi:hypothetical protein